MNREELLEILIKDKNPGGQIESPDLKLAKNDQELKSLAELSKIIQKESEKIDAPEEVFAQIFSEIKASVTENSDIRYNIRGGLGRSSNPNKWELILNFMNKTKILIPAGLVILVLVITGISVRGSEDISVLNREFQGIEKLDSEFSTVIDQEIDDSDVSTYLSSNSSVENFVEDIDIENDSAEINSMESSFDSLINEENETNAISSSF